MQHDRKVLLVDDHEMIRIGVTSRFAALRGDQVQWLEATCLQDGIQLYSSHPDIDLVLLDLNLADAKGLQGLRQFRMAHPGSRVVVFSGTEDGFVIGQARALGAVGYVSKCGMGDDLEQTLQVLLPPDGADSIRLPTGHTMFPHSGKLPVFDRLSELGPRHLEILELVLSGCTNDEIADATRLALGTIKNYVSALLFALDVRSRSHLISLFR
jgi:DNA-binding NarL/FixJ family response regulator